MAAETPVQHGLVLGAAARQDVVPERTGDFSAEDALLPEQGECVGLEYLGPLVGVVSGTVASGKNVAERRGYAGAGRLRQRPERLQDAVLEVNGAAVRQLVECMPGHVEDAELKLADLGIGGVEIARADDTLHE